MPSRKGYATNLRVSTSAAALGCSGWSRLAATIQNFGLIAPTNTIIHLRLAVDCDIFAITVRHFHQVEPVELCRTDGAQLHEPRFDHGLSAAGTDVMGLASTNPFTVRARRMSVDGMGRIRKTQMVECQ